MLTNETSVRCQLFVATMQNRAASSFTLNSLQFARVSSLVWTASWIIVCDVLCALCRGKTIVRRSHCSSLIYLDSRICIDNCYAPNPRFHSPHTELPGQCQISVIYARNSRTITTRPDTGLNHMRRVGTRCGKHCGRNSSR